MELYGSHFVYNGTNSNYCLSTRGLIFVNCSTDRYTSIAGEIEINSVFTRNNLRKNYIGASYSDAPFEFEVEIIADDENPLTLSEQKQVERWLFYQQGYKKLYVSDSDATENEDYVIANGSISRFYLNCIMTSPEKMEYNGGVIGYKCKLVCDSGFVWQEAVTKSFSASNISSGSGVITVATDMDIDEHVYPKVTIVMGSTGGDITLSNNTLDSTRLTTVKTIAASATLIMNGQTNSVKIGSQSAYSKFYNRNFVRLRNGNNQIAITGDVSSITFEWQNRRFL